MIMSREHRYVVIFLIMKEVEVSSLDDIQAELEAAQQLTWNERECVVKYKVYDDEEDKELYDFCNIDKEWWAENDLISKD